MKALYDLKEMLSAELEEIARKPEMGAGDLELVHKLTDTIKNIDKICALEEEGGYSEAGDWEGAYNRGSSYSNRGKHYVRGHYSRDGRIGDYSRHDARNAMLERAQDLMGSATTEREREAVRRLISELGQG
jgi:hypothetical protein